MATELHFATGMKDEAVSLVRRYHYSHRETHANELICTWHESGGLFGDLGEVVGAVFFRIPPTRWSEEVLELSRLVRRDDVQVSLTGLIAKSCKILKERGYDLLVSFADKAEGHHGGVYQAASWNYNGQRESRLIGMLVNGKYVAGRTCNDNFGTQSFSRASSKYPEIDFAPVYDEGKYLYWRALNKDGRRKAERLGLKSAAYPKPTR